MCGVSVWSWGPSSIASCRGGLAWAGRWLCSSSVRSLPESFFRRPRGISQGNLPSGALGKWETVGSFVSCAWSVGQCWDAPGPCRCLTARLLVGSAGFRSHLVSCVRGQDVVGVGCALEGRPWSSELTCVPPWCWAPGGAVHTWVSFPCGRTRHSGKSHVHPASGTPELSRSATQP